jgi:tetratricopeptide (TPR) repeat protein
MSEYEEVIALNPSNGQAIVNYIDSFYHLHEKAETRGQEYFKFIQELKKEADGNFESAEVHFKLGYAYFRLTTSFNLGSDERSHAMSEFKHAISIDPDFLWAYWGIKRVYDKINTEGKEDLYAENIEICKQALQRAPENPQAYYELAKAYQENFGGGTTREAINNFQKAIALKPDYVEAHYELATIYRVKSMYDEAIKEYNLVIDLAPHSTYAKDAKRTLIYIEKSRDVR